MLVLVKLFCVMTDTNGEAMVENGVEEEGVTFVFAAKEFIDAIAGLTVRDHGLFRGKRWSNMVGVA